MTLWTTYPGVLRRRAATIVCVGGEDEEGERGDECEEEKKEKKEAIKIFKGKNKIEKNGHHLQSCPVSQAKSIASSFFFFFVQ